VKGKLLQAVWDTFSEEENAQLKARVQELKQQYLKNLSQVEAQEAMSVQWIAKPPLRIRTM